MRKVVSRFVVAQPVPISRHAEGMTDGSQGLREWQRPTPLETRSFFADPGGVVDAALARHPVTNTADWHPSGMRMGR